MSQDDLVRALETADFYPHRPRTVEHVQTHISHVFLAGPYVYKLKKAVRFPFLDFSTAELRRHFCREEMRLNRRLAPGVYLDALPIVRTADGGLALGGAAGASGRATATSAPSTCASSTRRSRSPRTCRPCRPASTSSTASSSRRPSARTTLPRRSPSSRWTSRASTAPSWRGASSPP